MENFKLVPTENESVFGVSVALPFQTRFIGTIDISGDGTFSTKRTVKHIFRKTQSLGINYSLLMSQKIKFRWIVIYLDGVPLVTSREYFISNSKCFQFGKKGFELQAFLPIALFGRKKVDEFENSQPLDLFKFKEVG